MPTLDLSPIRRDADRGRIAGRLSDVANAALDLVVPAAALDWAPGLDVAAVVPAEPILLPDGVADRLDLTATRTAVRHAADRVRVPLAYVDRLLTGGHGDLAAENLNVLQDRDDRSVLLRLLADGDGYLLRAVLSTAYNAIDNVDLLGAVMRGMDAADVGLGGCEVDADWTLDRFRLRIAVPQIAVAIPDLLADYRPPYSMLPGRDVHAPAEPGEVVPVMWAGLEVSNSETGGGAVRLVPRAVIQVCRNGLTRPLDVVRQVHMGSRLDEGVVEWSAATRQRAIDLTTSQVADAVRQFCSVEYLERVAGEMRRAKGITVESPSTAAGVVVKQCGLTEDEGRAVLDAFAVSGDPTVLGLGQAVTVVAQHAPDGDRQSELEAAFWSIVSAPERFAGVA